MENKPGKRPKNSIRARHGLRSIVFWCIDLKLPPDFMVKKCENRMQSIYEWLLEKKTSLLTELEKLEAKSRWN